MKIKKNYLLTAAILSVLGVNQSVMAVVLTTEEQAFLDASDAATAAAQNLTSAKTSLMTTLQNLTPAGQAAQKTALELVQSNANVDIQKQNALIGAANTLSSALGSTYTTNDISAATATANTNLGIANPALAVATNIITTSNNVVSELAAVAAAQAAADTAGKNLIAAQKALTSPVPNPSPTQTAATLQNMVTMGQAAAAANQALITEQGKLVAAENALIGALQAPTVSTLIDSPANNAAANSNISFAVTQANTTIADMLFNAKVAAVYQTNAGVVATAGGIAAAQAQMKISAPGSAAYNAAQATVAALVAQSDAINAAFIRAYNALQAAVPTGTTAQQQLAQAALKDPSVLYSFLGGAQVPNQAQNLATVASALQPITEIVKSSARDSANMMGKISADAAALSAAIANYSFDLQPALAQAFVNDMAEAKTTQFQARYNGTNGIAGTPAATMNMVVDGAFRDVADFDGSSAANKSNIGAASADVGGVDLSAGVGLQYGYYNINGKSVNTVTLPLSVTAKFNPKHELTISAPLSYIQTQGQSDAYQAGAGIAYKYHVTENWALTPSVNYSYRSFDNNPNQNPYWNARNHTSMLGGNLASKATWNFSQVGVSLINMIGYYQTLDSEKNTTANLNLTGIGNYVGTSQSNKGLENYIVKNGLHATTTIGGMKVGAYFSDTHYFGSQLYFNQLNEAGFTVKPFATNKTLESLSIDANYLFSIAGQHSNELNGFRLNLGYKF